jgi:molecular chaperone HscB
MDHFERLGLPRRFSVDPAELERAYLARSRAFHPDYHLAGSGADLASSLDASAAANEAYATLKDPFARAEYLLSLGGGDAGPAAKLPPAFLAEMLDVREAIDAARGKPAEAARMKADLAARLAVLAAGVAARFDGYEGLAPGDPAGDALRTQIRSLLDQARYVRRLADDLDAD